MPEKSVKIAILGAGSWGATLTWLFGSAGREVRLFTRDPAKAKLINEEHQINSPLKVQIPKQVKASSDLACVLHDSDIVIFCCQSQSMRELAEGVAKQLSSGNPVQAPTLVSAVKGLELNTLCRMSQVLASLMPGIAVSSLSGPNLASEVLQGLPAAAVIACREIMVAKKIQSELSMPKFRLYTNDDLIGVELGGTLKNVIAIAAGGCDGLELGSNAKAALITRGLAEISRLAVKLGARPATLAGLAGMGDLLATCAGPTSRNYRLGWELARGKKLAQALSEIGAVVEGITTARAVCELSGRLAIELPIAKEVDEALSGKTSPESAIMNLLNRPLGSELG